MNQEIERYLKKAQDCISDAQYLLKDERLEAASNRTYYAIFDALQALMVQQNVVAKSHQGVYIKFRELFIKTGILPIKLSEIVSKSFNLRQGADYENDFEITTEDVEELLEEAQELVETVRVYISHDSKN
ncbi:MAG: HEPN domain-containing protein [Runella slithyformis]|nr:MAG: HEPN domain-containing protein [Runella slithyformis]